MVTQVFRSSNKWFSTYISRIFGFNSRLKSEKAKSEKVYTQLLESGQVHTPDQPTIFEINIGAVVQNVGFPGFSSLYSPVKPTMEFELASVQLSKELEFQLINRTTTLTG